MKLSLPAIINPKSIVIGFLLLLLLPVYPQDTLKIMPLGNSITSGTYAGDIRPSGDMVGYRYQLYQSLTDAGYTFDFVGSENSGSNYLPTTGPDYTNHAGFPGYTAEEILYLLQTGRDRDENCKIGTCDGSYLEYYDPDIIYIHLGTNGLDSPEDADSIADDINDILNEIDLYETISGKTVVVFLCRILNQAGDDPAGNNSVTTYYNSLLDALEASRTEDSIVMVDMENGAGIDYRYSPTGDMLDSIHPDNSGYIKMGDQWFNETENINLADPVVSGMVNESTDEGGSFGITLDNFVYDPQDRDEEMTWSCSGQSNLNIEISTATRTATITPVDPNWNGSETLIFRATDPSGAYDEDTVTYTLVAVNDAPVITVPVSQSVAENASLVFSTANSNLISVSDADGDDQSITINITNGTFRLSTLTGLTGTGDGTATLFYSGTLTSINAALNNAYFRGTLNYSGSALISVETNDGQDGTDSESISVTVTSVNDDPVITAPVTQSVAEDASLIFSTANSNLISISDVDGDNQSVNIEVANGTFTLSATAGLTGSGSGSSSLSYSGTLANINAALNGAHFTGTPDYSGSASLTIDTDDGNGGTDSESIAITVTPVNDPPVITVPGDQSVAEDEDLVFNTANSNLISISDPDNDNQSLAVSISDGTFTLFATTGLSGTGSGTALLNYSGTLSNINNALNNAVFRGNDNFNGDATITVVTNDGYGGSDTKIINITVTALNDDPVITVPGTQSVAEDVNLLFNSANGNTISINDPESDNQSVAITVVNGTFTLSTLDGLTGNGSGTAALSYSGTIASINSALNNAFFSGTHDYHGSASISFATNDGHGGEDSKSITINVNQVNDPPVLNIPASQSIAEDANLVFNAANSNLISVGDVDDDDQSIEIEITNGTFTLSTTTGLTGSGSGSASLSYSGTLAGINAALNGAYFTSTSNFSGSASLTIKTDDDNGGSDTESIAITVTTVNDAPVITVPDVQSTTEDANLVFSAGNSNLISASDADGNNQSFTIAVTNGTFTLSTTTGLTGSGSGSASLSYSGTLAGMNTALNGAYFTSTSNFNGSASLTIETDDGNGGTDSESITITVTPVNDAPVITVPAAQNIDEDVSLVFNTANINLISISDTENNNQSVTIIVTNGTLTLSTLTGLTGNGNGSASLSYSGTLAGMNAALNGAYFRSDLNYSGNASISVSTNDGSGGTDSKSITVTVTPVNDAPVITIPVSQTITEDVNLVFNAGNSNHISISDADNNSQTVAINVTNGTFTLSTLTGLTGNGNGSSSLSYTGTLASINTALNNAYFRSNLNYNGNASVSITTNDGNDGTDSESVAISVIPVNDAPVITVPATQNVAEDVNLVFNTGNSNLIFISDDDNNSQTVTINVSNGTFTLSTTTGVTGSGSGSASLSYSGTLTNINAALNNAFFRGTLNHNGNATLLFITNDNMGGTDTKSIDINVTPVNDPPVITVPGIQNATEDVNLFFNTINGNVISVSDLENDNQSVNIAVTNGTFTLSAATGISVTGNGTAELTISGALPNINAALNNAYFKGTLNYNGSALLTINTNDGNGGTDSHTVDIIVAPVNDPPVATNVIINRQNNRIGTVNTGEFTYTDPETGNFMQGDHTYTWYRRLLPDGDTLLIDTVSTVSYTPVINDGGYSVCFEVTPRDNLNLSGEPVKSPFYYVNAVPEAGNVHIYAPDLRVSQTVYGRYSYSDLENNAAGQHTFQWYRSAVPSGTGTLIPTANDTVYKIKVTEDLKYIRFVVSPAAITGSTPGTAVSSEWIGPVESNTPTAIISGTDTICNDGSKSEITVTLTGEPPWSIQYRRFVSGRSEDITVNNIISSPYIFDAPGDGTYTMLSVSDVNYTSGLVSGSAVISYYPEATARLTGSTEICPEDNSLVSMTVDLTGTAPWSFVLKRNQDDTTFANITQNRVVYRTRRTGIYKIVSLFDKYCTGDTVPGYGTAVISAITSPKAILSGADTICPGDTAILHVQFTGEAPFSVTYLRNGTNARTINNIRQHDYMLKVVGNGTYTLSAVTDQVRTGCVSGTGTVVYYPIPTASISGSGSICEHNSKNLMVAFTGTAPWNFSYHRNDEVPVSINNITAPSHSINVKLEGSYTLVNVSDHYCNGTVSGNAVVTVTPAPEVTITGLSPAYSYQDMSMIPVFGEPESGTFMPPLVEIRDTNYFLPYLAGIGIHTIVYSYRDVVTGCFGYDTAIIAVLAADADIIFPDNDTKKFFCFNDAPFILHGHNTKNSIGTFTISGGAGLADNHDNTATVYPSQLKSGTYQVTYKYFNETWLEVKESFEVEYVSELRFIGFDRTAYCDNEDRISLNGNIAGGVFSGRAVTGNVTTGFNFEPKLAYAGPDTVFYTLTTARGCSRQIFKHLIIRDAPNINFTVDGTCFSSSAADSTSFINLTTSTDTVRSWLWTFGDATSQNDSSTLMNPKHKYTRDGTKRITLKANTDFCENSGSIIFNFGRKPIADFDWSSECFHEGQGIRFINKSSSVDPVIIDGYKWKFHTGEKYDSLSSRDAEYVYSDTGNYKVELFIHSNFGCTDKRIKTLPLRPTYQMAEGASYFEGFENGMAGWLSTSENTVNSWRMDTPADAPGEGFVGAAKGDYAWYTNITVDNAGTAPREQSAVTSPCFDFSGIHKPMIRFDLWRWFNNNLNDGAVMQYKADTGTAWKNVGDLHDGISWYLDHKISGNPGGQPIGWSKTSNDAMWNEARHSLDELKNKTDVQFRIAYGSDSTARETHGMAFDNIWIGERNRIILIEHFTNSGDLDSKAADSSLDALANSNPYDIVDIQYHTSFPGTDPFNQQNKVDPGTRVLYYQLSSVPVSIVNGGADDDFIFDYDGNDLKPLLVKNQSLTTPKFSLSLETSMTDNALNINAELRPLESVINEQITLHIAVIERKITGITGANGDTLFESVLKTILSSTSYTNNWDPAVDFKTVTKSWNYKNAYNADEIRVIAFVQNEASKEIYQAAIDKYDVQTALFDNHAFQRSKGTIGFVAFPNPVYNEVFIRFEEALVKKTTLDLFDINGKLVLTKELYPGQKVYTIAMDDFPEGFCFMRMTSDKHFIGLQKLVISR